MLLAVKVGKPNNIIAKPLFRYVRIGHAPVGRLLCEEVGGPLPGMQGSSVPPAHTSTVMTVNQRPGW